MLGKSAAFNIGFDAKRIFHNNTGLGNYSRDLVNTLLNHYPENQYFLYNPKPARGRLFKVSTGNVFEKRPVGWAGRIFYNFWRQVAIKKDLRRDKIDIFHGLTGEIPLNLDTVRIRSVVTIHDLIFLRFPRFYSYFDRKIHAYKAKHAVNKADIVVAVSEQTKNDIIEYFNIKPTKIRVIYQGCQDVFRDIFTREEINKVRLKYHLPEKYFLNVGTIEERKNILNGIKAIKGLDADLVIVGSETGYTRTVKDYIVDNGLETRVHFPRGVTNTELAMIYQGASLFIYPSLFEGFGIPIIEALYSGIPVITSTGGCFSEAGGPGSIYVNPRNVDEIKSAILMVENNSSFRERIIQEGKAYAQRFNPENIAKQYFQLYNSLLNSIP